MELLIQHKQEKLNKKHKSSFKCDLKLFSDNKNIIFNGTFDFDYFRYGTKSVVTFEHTINFSLITGDVEVVYKIINNGFTESRHLKSDTKIKKNNFMVLYDAIENGLMRGEKRRGFWGIKYTRVSEKIIKKYIEIVQLKFDTKFHNEKDYLGNNSQYSSLFELFVDYHLEKKKIKGYDAIYNHILYEYPKKKWLDLNENKFLPAILDSYGIKSKYLIGELNKKWDRPILLSSLNYICKLFGDNHIDYLKKFVWEHHCFDAVPNKRTHELKNESEKDCMVKVIQNWEKENLKTDSFMYLTNRLLSVRELLENKGYDKLNFKAKNDSEYDTTYNMWNGLKQYYTRGYKLRYSIPKEILDFIEKPIELNNETYKVKVLTTEEDFRIEGYNMKNCMSQQFIHGITYLYVAIQKGRKRINLQYRKGRLIQSYGKANTPVDDISFIEASEELNKRLENYTTLEWKREKYDYLTDNQLLR
jgi:hypothetical protein